MDTDNPQNWIVCPACGSDEAGIIDWRPDDDTTLKCIECGERCDAEYSGDDFAERVYG